MTVLFPNGEFKEVKKQLADAEFEEDDWTDKEWYYFDPYDFYEEALGG